MPLLSRPRPSQTTNRPPAAKPSRLPAVPNRTLKRSSSSIDLQFTLKNAFRKESFRGCQREAIEAALADHDVFVLAPTGMGKSLCYQLPALAVDHGLTLVVSPLLALMQNQVAYLQSLSLPAATLNSTLPTTERIRIYDDLKCGHPHTRLLYITPELAAKASFRKTLEKINRNGELRRFVIDEGHCISEWGHDFRKDYRSLSYFRLDFPKVPIMVLTATATEKVREDVLKLLRLLPPRLKTFIMSFSRPNLHYEVIYKSANEDTYPKILKMIKEFNENRHKRLGREGAAETFRPVCGIIYSPRRILCDSIAQRLNSDGIKAAAYHAGLEAKERERILQNWVEGKLGVVVATVAFGMGVDRGDVRFVIHVELPKSIEGIMLLVPSDEAYYQESGRAGRDGKTARCILFYSREDVDRQRFLIAQSEARRDADGIRASQRPAGLKNFEAMVAYCEFTSKCRHRLLCEYFGDTIPDPPKKPGEANRFCDYACDVCRDPAGTRKQKQDKLTPFGSQDPYATQEEANREVEMQIYDMNLDKVPDTEDVVPFVIESDHEERENIPPLEPQPQPQPQPPPQLQAPPRTTTTTTTKKTKSVIRAEAVPAKRNAPEDTGPSANKRASGSRVTYQQREETRSQFLALLNGLEAPANLPDLLTCVSRRLEQDMYDKVVTDQSGNRNVLGRSSTLVTVAKTRNLMGLYTKEKGKLMHKIEAYVKLATSEDAALEQVQQGDIWETICEILDENNSHS